MKNLKAFAKANETLTEKAMVSVQGGAEGQNPLTETFTISAKQLNVLHAEYKLLQEVDATGRQIGVVEIKK